MILQARQPRNILVLALIFCLFMLSCSSFETLTGKIYYSGNEPFIQISLQLPDGTAITFCRDSQLLDSLEARIDKNVTVQVTYRNEYDQDCYEVLKIIK